MKIIDATKGLSAVYPNGSFEIEKWSAYIGRVHPALGALCLRDMQGTLAAGTAAFERDCLPVLNDVIGRGEALETLRKNFDRVTGDLNAEIGKKFGKVLDVDVILYLGLCNGAGWVETLDGQVCCLLGAEKILELGWYDVSSLYGLLYHELGHVYQAQYGILKRELKNGRQRFLWQLFTEGIAMYFEQTLIGEPGYYHQDRDGWKAWCDAHIRQLAGDFARELEGMTRENQRYFGDWVSYEGRPDVGYYLGTRFVRYICEKQDFDALLSWPIENVEEAFCRYLEHLGA